MDDAAKALVELEAGGDVRVLDLLAKVRAQKGQYVDAEALWTRAKALSGGDEYDAALKRVRALRSRPTWVRAAPLIVAAAAVATLATLLARGPRKSPSPPLEVASVTPSVAAPERHVSASEHDRASVVADRLGDFSGLGVHQVAQDGAVELTFAEGLFQAGVSLRSDAAAIIDRLGARLGTLPEGTVVIVTGHADDIPVPAGSSFVDNAALGLARATVVMKRLVTGSSLPVASFLVGTAGDGGAPYPNQGRENRLRNRTVTIRLMRDARGR